MHLEMKVEPTLLVFQIVTVFGSHEMFCLLFSYYAPPVFFSCFAYSSSGTPNFLAIATCDDVSFTVLRPGLTLLLAEATV